MWEDVYEAVDKVLIEEAIGNLLSKLTDRQRTILVARYFIGMTYKEIGDKFKVCPGRASQIEARALRILRGENFTKEFEKLGLGWIEAIQQRSSKYIKEENKKRVQESLEWMLKREEEEKIRIKEANAKLKLRIIEHDQTPPQTIVIDPVKLFFPPPQVKLKYNDHGSPYLFVNKYIGSIERSKDPEVYDFWLTHLLSKELNNNRP